MEKAIQKAVEGGYYPLSYPADEDYVVGDLVKQLSVLDPLFWQALGKACGWKGKAILPFLEHRLCATGHTGHSSDQILWVDEEWQMHWHRFIDHLAEGKDAGSFFNELLKCDGFIKK